MMTNTKMCVFNRYVQPLTKAVTFKKHIIDNVFWDDIKATIQDKGYDKRNTVQVFIPKDKNDISAYVEPKEYDGETNWTLNIGDIIVKGDVEETEVNRLSELSSKYENVFTILTVDNKDYGSSNMQHFEIKGE